MKRVDRPNQAPSSSTNWVSPVSSQANALRGPSANQPPCRTGAETSGLRPGHGYSRINAAIPLNSLMFVSAHFVDHSTSSNHRSPKAILRPRTNVACVSGADNGASSTTDLVATGAVLPAPGSAQVQHFRRPPGSVSLPVVPHRNIGRASIRFGSDERRRRQGGIPLTGMGEFQSCAPRRQYTSLGPDGPSIWRRSHICRSVAIPGERRTCSHFSRNMPVVCCRPISNS